MNARISLQLLCAEHLLIHFYLNMYCAIVSIRLNNALET
jgi:hypothetical protein